MKVGKEGEMIADQTNGAAWSNICLINLSHYVIRTDINVCLTLLITVLLMLKALIHPALAEYITTYTETKLNTAEPPGINEIT